MGEYEQNEVAIDGFQEDPNQISRRRFIRLAAMSGVASASMAAIGSSQAQLPPDFVQELRKEADRCGNTRRVFLNDTVNDAFKSKTFEQVLTEAKVKRKVQNVDGLPDKIQKVIIAIDDPDLYLRDYFIYPNLVSENEALKDALTKAKALLCVPFINEGFDFVEAKKLLHGEAPFLNAFGNLHLGTFTKKLRNTIGEDDEDLLKRAHDAGFFRSMSREEYVQVFGFGADECAYQREITGLWDCKTSAGDKCEIVDNSPTASTNLCP